MRVPSPGAATLLLIVNLLASLIVAIITVVINPQTCFEPRKSLGSETAAVCAPSFDAASTFLLGLLVFIALTLLELSINTSRLLKLRRREAVLWEIEDDISQHLYNALLKVRKVAAESYNHNDRYLRYFKDKIKELEDRLSLAADSKNLEVPIEEFQTASDIEGAFRQESPKVFSHTWPVSDGEELFTTGAWKRFFGLLVAMLDQGKLQQVRSLLIVDIESTAESANIDALLRFYARTPGMTAKIVFRVDFNSVAPATEQRSSPVDFGIYDSSLLYVTHDEVGLFTKDTFRINSQLRTFDTIWDSDTLIFKDSRNFPKDSGPTLAALLRPHGHSQVERGGESPNAHASGPAS